MGIETEYALGRSEGRGGRSSGAYLAELVLRRAYSDLECLRSESGHGVFLTNGALLYVDVGSHVEMATAECGDPLEATRQVFAGDHLLEELLGRVLADDPSLGAARFHKTNVDNRGSTWGSHESYAIVGRPSDFGAPLASFLATRILFTGSGGLDQRERSLRFALSPRASFVERAVSGSSTHGRGIVHDKHEPLACAPFRRLHLTCGDSLRSHYATWLRLGTTALVVAALDAGARPGRDALLPLPVKALRAINVDTSLRRRLPVASGERVSALAIQRLYLQMVECAGRRGLVPEWWPSVCREWRAVLDRLERDPAELAGRLDWPLRRQLFEARLAGAGLSWQQVRLGPTGRHDTPLLPFGDALDDPDIASFLVGGPRRLRSLRARARARDAPIVDELREIDVRFGELGSEGLHARLESAGLIAHRLFDDASISRASSEPPRVGRGRARGRAVRELAREKRRRAWASWTEVNDVESGSFLDLRHPLRDRVFWRAIERPRSEGGNALSDDVPF